MRCLYAQVHRGSKVKPEMARLTPLAVMQMEQAAK